MKTLFSLGFQANNPFSVKHPSLGQWHSIVNAAITQASAAQAAAEAAEAEKRAKLQAFITKGNQKLAQVRSWINAQAAKDPTLLSTFKQQYVVDNWRGYEDLVSKDQYYADLAAQKIASLDPINWTFSEETLSRIEEWNQVIDIMVAGMQEYGAVAVAPVKGGPTSVTGVTGAPIQSRIAPGATLTTPPPPEGISTKTLLIGGGVLAAVVGLVLALKG